MEKKSVKKLTLFIVAGIIVILLAAVICINYLFSSLGTVDLPRVGQELDPIVNDTLRLIENREYDKVYLHMTSETKGQISVDELASLLEPKHAVFEGIIKVTPANIEVKKFVGTNGQQEYYIYIANLEYSSGDKGVVTAQVINEDGAWKIQSFNVNKLF